MGRLADRREPRLRRLHGHRVPPAARPVRRRARATLAREYVGGGASWQATDRAARRHPNAPGGTTTTTGASRDARDDAMAAALDQAGADLRAAFGDPVNWTLGPLHRRRSGSRRSEPAGIGPLEWYFNKGPYPLSGHGRRGQQQLFPAGRAYPDPNDPDYKPVGIGGVFEVTNLPSYRLAIDLADPDGARIVQTTGQSGNPFDGHYGDLIDEWRPADRSRCRSRGGGRGRGGAATWSSCRDGR